MSSFRTGLIVFALSVSSFSALQAQTVDPQMAEAADALQACSGFAERRQLPDAEVNGRRAQALFQKRLERQPRDVDALVGLARAESQCIIPSADMATQGELSTHAIELLENALAIDPTHWTARFVLASINLRSPSFLGRAPRAAKEFDDLLRQQGDRTDNPRFARVFEYRGAMYARMGQPDSARALFERGARLFPADTALRGLAERAAVAKPAQTPPTASAPATLGAVRVVVSSAPSNAGRAAVQQIGKSQVLMTAGGAADVMQSLQMQPGATRVSEGSDIYTRGGDASETSLIVNGGRLSALSRFEGLNGGMFGAIEPFVVKSVRYSSGGFSVQHGNALSGVIEIETDGRPRERQLRAGLSLVQASGTARIPFTKTLGGWVSGRASQTQALLATHGRSAEFQGAPHSVEGIASLIANPSPASELRATAIVEQDDARPIVNAAGWKGPFHAAGGMSAVVLSSRWIASSTPLTIRTNATMSTRSSDWDFGVLARARDERNVDARVDAEYAPTEAMTIRGGAEQGSSTRGENGALPTTGSVAPGSPLRMVADVATSANQIGAYAETQLTRAASSITVGLRADRLPGERGATLDPRIALTTQRGLWLARVGAGLFHQGRWRAEPAVPDAGTPSGLARAAQHVSVGLERDGATTFIRAEAFRKQYSDYGVFGAGPQVVGGSANGVDVLAQRKGAGRVTGWLSYSLLDANVDLLDGRHANSPFDITHSVTTSATTTINANWSVGTTLRYGTGAPHTPVTGGFVGTDGRIAPVYGDVMSERLPAYVRADARLMRFIRAPGFLLTSFVEVINVGNHHNSSAVTYDASYQTRSPVYSFFASRTVVVGGEFQFQ
ncbi:MAG: outer rane receptor protein [Gemmatimonadetes bacterium]|nr:outer rane receptor protein [Gemmatimonadota bacterium]